ncbi:transposable element Tc3 transposase [Trichonephila clavipes]|nr:transposable element Tc3 transposase [Trichonephila clavipes]
MPRSSTHAQSHLGMPNRRNKVTKNGNGPSKGLFACLATNPASNCVLTIIEDVSGDAQNSAPSLLSLLYALQALNQELWCGVTFLLTSGPLWSSLEAHLQHSGTSMIFYFVTIPIAVPYPYFSENKELWFQQDGAACHTARGTIDLLKDTFGDRLISRFRPVNWPPRSCDLTPLDYFLWGYVKSLVYADKPQTLDDLEHNIRRVIAHIRLQMLENSLKIGRPDWTTTEPAMAVICQKSYLQYNATRLSFEYKKFMSIE